MTTTGRVLVVDDDPIIITILNSFFASRGIREVLNASNGKEAKTIIEMEAAHVGLVVMDLNMPEMDGIELLNYLHSIKFDGPLVICSASHEANAQSAQMLAKAYGLDLGSFVRKPLSRDKLDQAFGPLLLNTAQANCA